jgi:TRAP-type mannitol/chloroaromatic compound transport system permease small subunit
MSAATPGKMPLTVRAIESFIDRIGQLTAWVAIVMIGLVALNVLLRYSLSLGSVWAQELEWHLLAALILLGMCHAATACGWTCFMPATRRPRSSWSTWSPPC